MQTTSRSKSKINLTGITKIFFPSSLSGGLVVIRGTGKGAQQRLGQQEGRVPQNSLQTQAQWKKGKHCPKSLHAVPKSYCPPLVGAACPAPVRPLNFCDSCAGVVVVKELALPPPPRPVLSLRRRFASSSVPSRWFRLSLFQASALLSPPPYLLDGL